MICIGKTKCTSEKGLWGYMRTDRKDVKVLGCVATIKSKTKFKIFRRQPFQSGKDLIHDNHLVCFSYILLQIRRYSNYFLAICANIHLTMLWSQY